MLGVSSFTFTGIGKIYPIKLIEKKIKSYLKSDFIEIEGHKMFLDDKDSLSLSIKGYYEPFETELFKKEIKEGDNVVDIGANIGYYTLIFAKLVGKNGMVFAFEPDPLNFAILKKNIEINGYKNVILIQKAISNKNGKLNLYLNENNGGDHRLYAPKNEKRKAIIVESVRIDDYFKDFKKDINLIKIDIQGAEWEAIQGMDKLLNQNKKINLVTEFWPRGLKRGGINPREYIKFLKDKNFKIYEIDESKEKIVLFNINKFLKKHIIKKEKHTNLFCIK